MRRETTKLNQYLNFSLLAIPLVLVFCGSVLAKTLLVNHNDKTEFDVTMRVFKIMPNVSTHLIAELEDELSDQQNAKEILNYRLEAGWPPRPSMLSKGRSSGGPFGLCGSPINWGSVYQQNIIGWNKTGRT